MLYYTYINSKVAANKFCPSWSSVVETYHPAGIRRQVAQQDAEKERNWAKSSARADELEALIADTKDSVRRSARVTNRRNSG